eukprot:508195-Alexandrium_andersonii.AAC.1
MCPIRADGNLDAPPQGKSPQGCHQKELVRAGRYAMAHTSSTDRTEKRIEPIEPSGTNVN